MLRSRRPAREVILNVDVCAIGAGSGGLAAVRTATALGLKTVLIERGRMGGDCLNWGCVPSKALLAAAHTAARVRHAHAFGLPATLGKIGDGGVYRHIRSTIAKIEPNDSQARYEKLGVRIIRAEARFVGPNELRAGRYRVRARWFVVATGARAAIPPISGLAEVPYLTNETVFFLKKLPRRLIVLGGGPLGVEMAQAHRRLGVEVALLEKDRILRDEDPELVAYLRRQLKSDGIAVHERIRVTEIRKKSDEIEVLLAASGRRRVIKGTHLLVAAGRNSEIEALNLAAAGVEFTKEGIVVDAYLRTTNPRIFAIGDVIGGDRFSHLASHHGQIAIANAVLKARRKAETRVVPRVVFTEPELAQVGPREAAARSAHRGVRTLRWTYDHNDRAVAERTDRGMIKVVVDRKGNILGVGIVGPHAGEVVQKWSLAIARGIGIGAMSRVIAPYPTIGYSDRKLAESSLPVPLPGIEEIISSRLRRRKRPARAGRVRGRKRVPRAMSTLRETA